MYFFNDIYNIIYIYIYMKQTRKYLEYKWILEVHTEIQHQNKTQITEKKHTNMKRAPMRTHKQHPPTPHRREKRPTTKSDIRGPTFTPNKL
jgi:hypothetical protein